MRRRRTAAQRRRGRDPFAVGLVALLLLGIAVYLGFAKDIPFTRGFQLHAVFESANSLRPNSPVRIAGVEVGRVKKVEAADGSSAAVVTMEIADKGLPIHKDARARIRPRIFLEGNFFVELEPGSAGSPELDDGDTLKVTQTATPVQLDQVLTALQHDTREDLKQTLDGLGTALSDKPTAAQDRESDRAARGESAARSLNDATKSSAAALRSTAQVSAALLGVEPDRDLQRLVTGLARTTGGLARNEQQLKGLVTSFNRTLAALAGEQLKLRATVRELAPTLEAANPALDALNASFPPTRALARELIPGVRETPATIHAGFPWIAQARKLLGPDELRGVAQRLAPTTRDLAALTDQQIEFLPQADLISRCALENLLPTGDVVIHDEFTSGKENYKEFFYALVGLTGESQNFDGNGLYVRFAPGGGSQTVSLGSAAGKLYGNANAAPLGTRPAFPGKRPPYRSDVPCYKSPRPSLNGPAAAKGPGERPE